MAAAGIALVLGIIAGQPDEDIVFIVDLGRQPSGPDVLVVIFEAGGEIVAEAGAAQPRDRAAEPEDAGADRRAAADDEVGLLVGAERAAHAKLRLVGKPPSHIFDRAADRVAAVE